MKKYLIYGTCAVLCLSFLGCSFNKHPEKELDDVTISKEEVTEEINDDTPEDSLTEEQKAMIEEMESIDEPLSDTSEDVTPGALFVDLYKLQNCNNMWQFRTDLNAYLLYLFPELDKQYSTYVIEGSEKDEPPLYYFKVKVEGINEDGSDLIVECQWKYGAATEHYTFFSDLTPEGTDVLLDKDGNPMSWDTPLKPYDEW